MNSDLNPIVEVNDYTTIDYNMDATVRCVYNSLNLGLSWDKIEKTIYPEIEKKREQNASVSDFAKLIFKIEKNNKLLYISSNIGEIDKQRSVISVICSNPHPNWHLRDIYDLAYIKGDPLDSVPFLKSNTITIVPRERDAHSMDC